MVTKWGWSSLDLDALAKGACCWSIDGVEKFLMGVLGKEYAEKGDQLAVNSLHRVRDFI